MKNTTLENRMRMAHNRSKIPDDKLSMGSTKEKFPVLLDDGKTIIYISDKSKIEETKQKYAVLKNSKFPSRIV